MDRETAAQSGTGPATINRGDLFWIEPDESRGSIPGSSHPHVVIQDDVFNRSRISTVIVCALTSNLNRANEPGNVRLEVGEGNLPKQSVVVVSQVSAVYKARLGERIGALSDDRVEQILDGMRFQQASFFNR
jgi:mRNA interferase MazF